MPESPVFDVVLFLVVLFAIGSVLWYSFSQKKKSPEKNAYLEGLEYLVDGNDRLAMQKFKEAVREDSENVSAYLRLGDLLRKKSLVANAVRIHRDLTLRAGLKSEQNLQILKSLLMDYDAGGHVEEGIATAKKILTLDRDPELWVIQNLLALLEAAKRWEEAEESVNRYADRLPLHYQSRLAIYLVQQGLALQEIDHSKEARMKYKEALKKDSQCAAAYYYLGKSYQSENRLNEAVEQWKRLCKNVPQKAPIVFPELEKAWFEIGRFTDMENLYQEMLSVNNKGLEIGLALAEIYSKKGEYDQAIEVLEQMEEDFHSDPSLISKKVHILYNRGHYKQAANQSILFFNSLLSNHREEDETVLRDEILRLS